MSWSRFACYCTAGEDSPVVLGDDRVVDGWCLDQSAAHAAQVQVARELHSQLSFLFDFVDFLLAAAAVLGSALAVGLLGRCICERNRS